jgi:hypothetical protein
MCAINPQQQRHFKVSFYTVSQDTEQFNALLNKATEQLLLFEIDTNRDGRIRCHVTDAPLDFTGSEWRRIHNALASYQCTHQAMDLQARGETQKLMDKIRDEHIALTIIKD